MKCIRNFKTNMITRVSDAEAWRLVYMENNVHHFVPKHVWKNQVYSPQSKWTQEATITFPSGKTRVVPVPSGMAPHLVARPRGAP